ncbi:hypothetical protein HPB49_022978 [Dermacentor silvarum]|uniref:Uncharacterized protein n=1 Tax=Dermacentor silvarum TaxID=543639 RepID=A0ACB8D8K9_DERSI|nr:hypothetical protein HPB49_022978 [Dermacentor silvarum]
MADTAYCSDEYSDTLCGETVHDGEWRHIVTEIDTKTVPPNNRPTSAAMAMRDEVADYFMSAEGSLPWQLKHINASVQRCPAANEKSSKTATLTSSVVKRWPYTLSSEVGLIDTLPSRLPFPEEMRPPHATTSVSAAVVAGKDRSAALRHTLTGILTRQIEPPQGEGVRRLGHTPALLHRGLVRGAAVDRHAPSLCLGLTPVVGFSNASPLAEVGHRIPLERLLLETDAPYFLPKSVRPSRAVPSSMAVQVATWLFNVHKIHMQDILEAIRSLEAQTQKEQHPSSRGTRRTRAFLFFVSNGQPGAPDIEHFGTDDFCSMDPMRINAMRNE